eukprot:5093698-Alexandrium_andersonii.AAC.1
MMCCGRLSGWWVRSSSRQEASTSAARNTEQSKPLSGVTCWSARQYTRRWRDGPDKNATWHHQSEKDACKTALLHESKGHLHSTRAAVVSHDDELRTMVGEALPTAETQLGSEEPADRMPVAIEGVPERDRA